MTYNTRSRVSVEVPSTSTRILRRRTPPTQRMQVPPCQYKRYCVSSSEEEESLEETTDEGGINHRKLIALVRLQVETYTHKRFIKRKKQSPQQQRWKYQWQLEIIYET